MKTIKIGIIDYGIGNIKSVVNALNLLGYSSIVSNDPNDMLKNFILIRFWGIAIKLVCLKMDIIESKKI